MVKRLQDMTNEELSYVHGVNIKGAIKLSTDELEGWITEYAQKANDPTYACIDDNFDNGIMLHKIYVLNVVANDRGIKGVEKILDQHIKSAVDASMHESFLLMERIRELKEDVKSSVWVPNEDEIEEWESHYDD